jgi:hypothetical protein
MPTAYQLEKFNSGMHYIMLDSTTVARLSKDDNKRIICTLNETESFHCALMPKSEGGHFITIGLKHCKKLKINEGSTVTASFEIDTSEYQFEMPEELAEVLNSDLEAHTVFHNLTAGNQRGLIYLVGQVKSSDKKIERALKIAQQIKHGKTSPRQILK